MEVQINIQGMHTCRQCCFEYEVEQGWRNRDGTFNAGCAIHDGVHPYNRCLQLGVEEWDMTINTVE